MQAFQDFSLFESQFLLPLSQKQLIKSEDKPLEAMENWHLDEQGFLSSSFFQIVGRHTDVLFDVADASAGSMHWDQPIYQQPSSDLALFIDEHDFLLVRAVMEPGNAQRGYHGQGLMLCTSYKMSAGNVARLKAQGKIPPFSDLFEHPKTKQLVQVQAPGDGARANKQNVHHLCRVPRAILEETYNKMDVPTRAAYALVTRDVFKEAYLQHGLMTEHLRDLTSMLLFI